MSTIDDDRLASLLGEAASSFDVPADGRASIITRARGGAAEVPGAPGAGPDPAGGDDRSDGAVGPSVRTGPLRRVAGAARRNRLTAVAACVVALLVALAAVGALTRPASRSASTSSLARPPAAPAHARTTPTPTVPGTPAQSPAPLFNTYGSNASANNAHSGSPLTQSQVKSGTTAAGGPSSAAVPRDAVGQSSRIEQSGTLGLAVGRGAVNRTVAALTALAGPNGGYVANSQTQTGAGGAPYGSVTLEVPVDNFAAVLKEAEALGRPGGVSTRATDVTGQYVDLQARIAALQSSRQQYLTIMARATTIGDVLSVQEQIDTIQSQIEQLQGQLQVLTSETAYSSLTATVNQSSRPPAPSPLPESGLILAWHQSLGGFVDGVEGVVRLAGPTLFALTCLGGVLVGGRGLWRRARRHRL